MKKVVKLFVYGNKFLAKVLVATFHLTIAHHCLYWILNLSLRTCSIDCFVLISV